MSLRKTGAGEDRLEEGGYKKSIGIIDLGRIGKAVAERAKGFSTEILAHDEIKMWFFPNRWGSTTFP
jgi:lactate dehydrogenase-like 2-hydroxyacid dehydrogenase